MIKFALCHPEFTLQLTEKKPKTVYESPDEFYKFTLGQD